MTSASHAEGRQFDPGQVYGFTCVYPAWEAVQWHHGYMSSMHDGARHADSVRLRAASLSTPLRPPLPLRRSSFVPHVRLWRAYRHRHGTSTVLGKRWTRISRSYGVTVSTLDSESSDRGSNPRRTFAWEKTLRVSASMARGAFGR
jgi:hypothetical protein